MAGEGGAYAIYCAVPTIAVASLAYCGEARRGEEARRAGLGDASTSIEIGTLTSVIPPLAALAFIPLAVVGALQRADGGECVGFTNDAKAVPLATARSAGDALPEPEPKASPLCRDGPGENMRPKTSPSCFEGPGDSMRAKLAKAEPPCFEGARDPGCEPGCELLGEGV